MIGWPCYLLMNRTTFGLVWAIGMSVGLGVYLYKAIDKNV